MRTESDTWRATVGGTEWIAADLHFDPSGDFVVGTIGFQAQEMVLKPDDEKFAGLASVRPSPFDAAREAR